MVGTEGIQGVALRYGNLYGPGTGFALDGAIVAAVRKRCFPIVGKGAGVWSFIHIEDAAAAVMAAIKCRAQGVYNIVDDEPAPVAVWLPELAQALGVKPSRHVPVWLGRKTQIRSASNEKAKPGRDWELSYPSRRQGIRIGLA